jgi:hypothetical protein
MIRLPQIAKKLKIGLSTILEYCKALGFTDITIHSKIDSDLENKITEFHEWKLNNSSTEISEKLLFSISETIPQEFYSDNPFESEGLEILSDLNRFSNRSETTIKYNETELKTIFSNFEAFSICSGIEDPHSRHIARAFLKGKELSDKDIYEAHYTAMGAYKKYGSKLLSYFISLPPLPFKTLNASQIFNVLDKRRIKQDFPILRISLRNFRNQTEKIHITYFAEKVDNIRKRNDNVLTVKNASTGQTLMRLSRDGIVIPEKNARQIVPVLQVFIRFSKDTKKAILNYGLETGECSICGRELTDSTSIRIGVGPICRQYL